MTDIAPFNFPSWDQALDFALFMCLELEEKMRIRRVGPADWEVTPCLSTS